MQITSLSSNPHDNCILLRWPGLCIMVDCPLDTLPALNFLPATLMDTIGGGLSKWQECPDLKIHQDRVFIDSLPLVSPPNLGSTKIEEIDAILISNSASMAALPYLSEQNGFRAAVYATDPTLQLGGLIMEELLELYERIATYESKEWKNKDKYKPLIFGNNTDMKNWRQLYSREDMNAALKRVHLVAFKEYTSIHGLLRVTACSSGFSIGSVNWVLDTDFHKVVYMSGCSSVTAHPQSLDCSSLSDAHVAIVTNMTQCPTQLPNKMLMQLCATVMTTIGKGGSVLLPCTPTGILYDLFECLGAHLDENQSLAQTPMYFVSPVGESTLAYANIFAEWLSTAKQSKVFVPEEPFTHGIYVRDGRLKCYPAVYKGLCSELKTPCIAFAGHPSLRFGDVVELIGLWKDDPNCALIVTDASYDVNRLVAPFQPMNMQVKYIPIETRIDFSGINRILNQLQPKQVVVAEKFSKPPDGMENRPDLTVQWDNLLTYTQNHTIQVDMHSPYTKVKLDPSLAKGLDLVDVGDGVSACSIAGYMSCYDNKYEMRYHNPQPSANKENRHNDTCLPPVPPPIILGTYEASQLIDKIKQLGIDCSIVTQDRNTTKINVASFATISLTNGLVTNVAFNANCDVTKMKVIRDAIYSCVVVL